MESLTPMTTAIRKPRPLPEPPTFFLATLPDDMHLTQAEVAGSLRQSMSWTEKRRLAGTDGLEWVYIGARARCLAGSLKRKLTGNPGRLPIPENLRSAKKAPKSTKSKPKKQPHHGAQGHEGVGAE
jgi:hypothetical protein